MRRRTRDGRAAGGAGRPQRRRQDQCAGCDLPAVAGPRPARRQARRTHPARPGAPGGALWAVAATVARGGETFEIGTGLTHRRRRRRTPAGAPQRRRRARLGRSGRDRADGLADAGHGPAVHRRRQRAAQFLDRLVVGFDPGHARRAARYEQAMRERARLLKYGPRDPPGSKRWSAKWPRPAWRSSARARRGHCPAQRRPGRTRRCRQLSRAPSWRSMARPTSLIAEAGDRCSRPRVQARLERMRMRDAEAGRTLFGPHRSDLSVRHTAKRTDARECSTGEQKALLISMVLAHARELSHQQAARRRRSCCWTRSRPIWTRRAARPCSRRSWRSAPRPG